MGDLDENTIYLKILILGDTNVGKTSLFLNYCDNDFPEGHLATIGVEYKIKSIEKNGLSVQLQIWDTAGQERFKSITKSYYQGANGILFVYDITNRKSFLNVKEWIKDVENKNNNFKKILVGNKIDLKNNNQIVNKEDEIYANNNNLFRIETSAKDGTNVDDAFNKLIDFIFENKKNDEMLEEFGKLVRNLSLTSENSKKKNVKRKCCRI